MLVQFGNNWIQKIPRTAKLDSGSHLNFSHPIISKLDRMLSYYIYKEHRLREYFF